MLRFCSVIKRLLFLAVLVVLSCEKAYIDEDDNNGAGETPVEQNGNLTVSIIQIGQTPISDYTSAAVTDVCTRLNFAVYNTAGTRVKQINQQLGNAGFGTASFQLEEGTYQLVVVAHSSSGNPTMTDPSKIRFTNAQGFTDTFIYNGTITIGTEPQTHTPSLSRITTLCRFVITGDIPANVSKMRFYYTGGSGAFNASTGLGSVNSKQDVTFNVTSGQKQFDLYTFLHNTEGTIHLKVYALDFSDNEYCQREFDVPMKQHEISWVSMDFFGSEDYKINIDINTDWNGEIHINF